MLAVGKILLTLTLIVVLLNRKVRMGNAMLAGSTMLFAFSGFNSSHLQHAIIDTLTSYSTWEIVFALYFVMCLEYQLRTGGIIDGLMSTARNILKSDRILLALMPSFLGFLPSLGGAIFSAPLVESASKSFNLTAEQKTAINYWFRHIWEFTNPLFTGMLLASQLSHIPLSVLITNMAWLTILSAILGWLMFLAPLSQKNNSYFPSATALDGTPRYSYVALSLGPVLLNLFLVVFINIPASISMALVVAIMTLVLRQTKTDIRSMLLHAFDGKLLGGVLAILFFQSILRQTGAIEEIAYLMNSLAIPNGLIVAIIGLISGLLTGTSQGFVAITFPFIMVLAPGDIIMVTICFLMGTAGQMLSPAHLCLIVTLDYFKADFLKTLYPVLALEIVMVALAYLVIAML